MPERKHVRGAGKKEQRQYEHILESARKEGRYGTRAKEVAARTVAHESRAPQGEVSHSCRSAVAGSIFDARRAGA